MKNYKRAGIALALPLLLAAAPIAVSRADDSGGGLTVIPGTFDPAHTHLVASKWVKGAGCPTDANVATYPSTTATGTYTDPACLTGDPSDLAVEGLLLVKTGPTSNNAAALATINGLPPGTTVDELGYDIRKPGTTNTDPRGSHCGAGAPRFNITTTTGLYFLGCNSPSPTTVLAPGTGGWMRLRWGTGTPGSVMAYLNGTTLAAVSGTVESIQIVFDEGYDTGPDNFGAAVLDNIDINGTLIGRGPVGKNGQGGGGQGGNGQGGNGQGD